MCAPGHFLSLQSQAAPRSLSPPSRSPASPTPTRPTLEELCAAARHRVLLRLGLRSPDDPAGPAASAYPAAAPTPSAAMLGPWAAPAGPPIPNSTIYAWGGDLVVTSDVGGGPPTGVSFLAPPAPPQQPPTPLAAPARPGRAGRGRSPFRSRSAAPHRPSPSRGPQAPPVGLGPANTLGE